MYKSTYCHTASDVPKTEHFAIVVFSSYYVEGDQRSRDHPGHGYPGHTEHTAQYRAFTNRAEWEEEVANHTSKKDNFVAMVVKPAQVDTVVKVNITT